MTYVSVDGPAASTADAFEMLRRELGISGEVSEGDSVRITLPSIEPLDALVDHLTIGLRTSDAMYRFFGRNAFGAPIGIAVHHFGDDVDQKKTEKAWRDWLNGVFA